MLRRIGGAPGRSEERGLSGSLVRVFWEEARPETLTTTSAFVFSIVRDGADPLDKMATSASRDSLMYVPKMESVDAVGEGTGVGFFLVSFGDSVEGWSEG